MSQIIKLPLPPSFNRYYARGKFITKIGKEYRMQVITAINRQNAVFKANIPLSLEIVVNYPEDGDLDNFTNTKGLFDALTHANVWQDDKLIKQFLVTTGIHCKKREEGSILLTIKPYEQ